MLEQRIDDARRLHRQGDLKAAISTYDEVLASEPNHAEVWHLKALAEHQSGRLEPALASIAKAIAIGGETAAILLVQGEVRHDRGELAPAEASFLRALALRPGWAAAHMDLGRVYMDQGRPKEALAQFQAAVSADPKHVRGWNNVGIALQALERVDEAIRAFNHALTLDPGFPLAHFNVARLLKLRGELDRALEHARLAVRGDERLVDAWLLLGDIHVAKGERDAAFGAFTAAVQAAPGNLSARMALAGAVAKRGAYEEARGQYRQIAAQFPASLRPALHANLLLPQVYESAEQLERVRSEYREGLARLRESASRFRLGRPENALNEARWTNFYLAYQGRDDVEPQREYGEFLRSVLAPAVPRFFEPRARVAGRERIRVGFLSHFFFNCTAGRYFASWITKLDPRRFETYVYYTHDRIVDDTRAIASAAALFKHRPQRSIHALAEEVAYDQLDILVYPELGMHMENFTLAALRLAPVQCCGWGHPTTPGHPEIDWYISCEAMEPPGAQAHYNERLALLPGLGTCYTMPDAPAEGSRADFGLPEDRTLYLVPQSLFKIHPDNDELIAQVLARDPRGVAVLFASDQDRVTETFAGRLANALARHKLDLRERVLFSRPVDHPTYLRFNQLCDVMIDTVLWSGGNTSLDALYMGLPVVTRPGELMRGRQSAAMLGILGVRELVAADFEQHVATVVRLGADADERRSLSERILAARGALFGREEPVRALEEFLERAAREG
jgi:CRISPR-associated protein Csy1